MSQVTHRQRGVMPNITRPGHVPGLVASTKYLNTGLNILTGKEYEPHEYLNDYCKSMRLFMTANDENGWGHHPLVRRFGWH